ncbi:tetratricopeptide repeat protein [Sporosarcina jeotgali]|uniref:Tetratricopeptide repeat protein n=1 Tax=Sporosarcina jeotgali TaxID=3020056 RepID=A0ABZ0KUX8_9BACL|nr:tetratricopeptide repeat protein [Sporosarcina sp. B2O-1]WOV83658.1 tetratricopeptide repeat protein [Sporosarcina sp. B2O-1]
METIRIKLTRAFELFDEGRLLEAEALYKDCLQSLEKSSAKYKTALHGLGFVHASQKEYNKARKVYKELREIARENSDIQEEHIAIHQLGMVERMAGNFIEAQALFDEELKLLEDCKPDFHLGFAANFYEQGFIMLKRHRLEEAEALMTSSLENSKLSEDAICLGCAYRGLGEVFLAKHKNEEAKLYFLKSKKAFEKGNDEAGVNDVCSLLLQADSSNG